MALSAVCLFGRNCYKMWRSLAGTVIKCGVVWPELIKCGFAHYVCLVGRNCYKMRHCVFVWPALYKIYRCLFVCLVGRNCYKMWCMRYVLFICLVRTVIQCGVACLFVCLVARNFIKPAFSIVCLFVRN